MLEIVNKVPTEERTPYVVVAFQECERMNMLTVEIRRSLKELDLGLKVFIIFSTIYLLVITFVTLSHFYCTVKPVQNGHSQKDQNCFSRPLSLNAG